MTKKTRDQDIAFIQALADLLKKNELTELEVMREYSEDDTLNVRVSQSQTPLAQPVSAPASVTSPVQSAPIPVSNDAPPVSSNEDPASHPGAVTSPMVGTVYLAATPGAKPFVNVGDRVQAGDHLCLIEAMKMFNQIEAEVSGTISARLIDNQQPVEFNQPLFIITED